MTIKHDYIGDGVYVSFNGFHIVIAVNSPENVVAYLERDVFNALRRYAKQIWGDTK